MCSTVDWVLQREVQPECSTNMQRDQIVSSNLVGSLQHTLTLHGHDGCVNTLNWNHSGTLLASGSDDQHILVWAQDGRLLCRIPTIHSNNIFSVLFVPCTLADNLLLSAAGDCQVLLHDINRLRGDQQATAHIQRWGCEGRVKKLAVCRTEPRLFWSASEDGILNQYDLRENTQSVLLDYSQFGQLKSVAVNDIYPEMLAVGISKNMVPIYDRRNMKEPIMQLLPAHLRLGTEGRYLATHLAFNQQGTELIANISSDNIYIFDVRDPNRNTSPDVLSAVKSFISEENSFPLLSKPHQSAQIDSFQLVFSHHFKQQISDAISFPNEKELILSKNIDDCSKALDSYLRDSWHIFSLSKSSLKTRTVTVDEVRSSIAQNTNCLIKKLLKKGCCLSERNWEGDQMDALRHFLSALRILPRNGLVHTYLLHCLYSLKQYKLARKCHALYKKIYPDDFFNANEIVRELEREIKTQERVELDKEYSENYRDYLDRFTGHLNINTDIKEANFFGGDDQYIVAGSDCGSLFIWERKTQRVVRVFKGDSYTVNCVQPHPSRCLIASSGIDPVIRFWEPAATALKETAKRKYPEEFEERDSTAKRYELMKQNRRKRSPDLFMEHLLNSIGIAFVPGESANESEEREDSSEDRAPNMIHCRQM